MSCHVVTGSSHPSNYPRVDGKIQPQGVNFPYGKPDEWKQDTGQRQEVRFLLTLPSHAGYPVADMKKPHGSKYMNTQTDCLFMAYCEAKASTVSPLESFSFFSSLSTISFTLMP